MPSKRKARLDALFREAINDGFDNFSAGVLELFGIDPRRDRKTGSHIKSSFRAAYSLFEWCRLISFTGKARFFLAEIRSALPLAIALAAKGLYEAAFIQLRYVCECITAFLYFRDHPRELQLALNDADQWALTSPKAVSKFLRKLPEFSSPVGSDLLSCVDNIYSELCGYAHPRKPVRMGQRAYLTQAAPDPTQAEIFQKKVEYLCHAASGIFWLGCRDDYAATSELSRVVLTKTIKVAQKKKIEQQIAIDNKT